MNLRRIARRVQFAIVVAAGAAAMAVLAFGSAAAAETPNLTGEWVNQEDTASGYGIYENAGELHVHWSGLETHSGLRGSFTGTFDGSRNAYLGTFHVEEGPTIVDGTGSITISSLSFHHYPLLDVSLTPGGGTPTTFTLEMLFPAPTSPKPGADSPVNVNVNCDGSSPCPGAVTGDVGGNPGSADTTTPAVGTSAAGHAVRVAYTQFKVKPGHSTTVKLRLNQAGRRLLARRGSLKVRIVVTMKKSAGLPPKTVVGTVTFHKR